MRKAIHGICVRGQTKPMPCWKNFMARHELCRSRRKMIKIAFESAQRQDTGHHAISLGPSSYDVIFWEDRGSKAKDACRHVSQTVSERKYILCIAHSRQCNPWPINLITFILLLLRPFCLSGCKLVLQRDVLTCNISHKHNIQVDRMRLKLYIYKVYR